MNLTKEQAYLAMFEFLRAYNERGASEEFALILGSMQLATDGRPMDPAYVEDWAKAVDAALAGRVDAQIKWVK